MNRKRIAAVILAAGASTRFGQPKQLLDWNDRPFVAHATDVALAAGLAPVIVVLGCRAEAVRAALGTRPVQIAMNWRWEEGMSVSVQVGLMALPPDTKAAIFMQCDQPLVDVALLRALAARCEETGASIVHPTHAGQRRPPVLFARSLFPELAAVTGDEGGRSLIARCADQVATVAVEDLHRLLDVDTPAEYMRLLALRDQRPPASNRLRAIRHLIVDMDGVLWHGQEPLPGLHRFFEFLHRAGVGYVLATNNSSRLSDHYVHRLARFGIQVPTERVLTSAQATAAYLADQASPGARVYVIGEEGIQEALKQHGFVLTAEGAEYVVVGWDRHLTWEKLKTAALLIHRGAIFVGTNPDTDFPTTLGPVPGNGAQLAALETATGVAPTVVGKPEPWLYEQAMRRMDAQPESTAVIGDRLDTDIAGGQRLGLTNILLLSGITTEADLAAAPIPPDLVYAGLEALVQAWEQEVS